MKIKIVKARKEYQCFSSKEKIEIDEKYKRVNIRGVGIFHFKANVEDYKINNFVNKYVKDYCYYEDENLTLCGDFGENGL